MSPFLLLKPKADFIIVNKLAPVGLGDTFSDSGAEFRIFFRQAQAFMRCDLSKVRFLLGGELDLRSPTVRKYASPVNGVAAGTALFTRFRFSAES